MVLVRGGGEGERELVASNRFIGGHNNDSCTMITVDLVLHQYGIILHTTMENNQCHCKMTSTSSYDHEYKYTHSRS